MKMFLIIFFLQILGGICRFILSNFGFKYASILGFPYDTVMSVSSASFVTTSILFITYIISGKSLKLVRSSLFVSDFFFVFLKLGF